MIFFLIAFVIYTLCTVGKTVIFIGYIQHIHLLNWKRLIFSYLIERDKPY